MPPSSYKHCSSCEAEKTCESFRKCSRAPDGYDWWCRNCRSDYETARRVRKGSSREHSRRNHDVVKPFKLEDLFKGLEGISEALGERASL